MAVSYEHLKNDIYLPSIVTNTFFDLLFNRPDFPQTFVEADRSKLRSLPDLRYVEEHPSTFFFRLDLTCFLDHPNFEGLINCFQQFRHQKVRDVPVFIRGGYDRTHHLQYFQFNLAIVLDVDKCHFGDLGFEI